MQDQEVKTADPITIKESNKNTDAGPQQQVDFYQWLEAYVLKNKNTASLAVLALAAIGGGIFYYFRFHMPAREQEAQEQMFMAQKYFEMDSVSLAINGDGNYLGFLSIADEYDGTKAGNLANYYLGLSYLRMGQYQAAIDYLKEFSSDDAYAQTLAWSAAGDAFMELNDTDEGINYYKKAASNNPNEMLTPYLLLKTGMALERTGEYGEAKEYYEKVKSDYPESQEGREIDKYIARAEGKAVSSQ